MRTGFITGVTDICEPTCVYRLWTNTETSQTLHNQDEWRKNHIYIQNKFKTVPVLLPAGCSEKLVIDINAEVQENAEVQAQPVAPAPVQNPHNKWSTIYFRKENGYNETDSIKVKVQGDGKITAIAEVGAMAAGCREFRWDPCEYTSFAVEGLSIVYTNANGEEKTVDNSKIYTNGYKKNQRIVFLKSDPKIMFQVTEDIKRIKIVCNMVGITDDMLSGIVKMNTKYYCSKVFGKIKRKVFGK